MIEFKQQLRRRIRGSAVYCVVVALLVVLHRVYGIEKPAFSFSLGFAVGIEAVMIYFMARYMAALRNEQKLKELYIEENDEREKHISSQIGESGIKIILVSLSVAMLISAYFNEIVFFTLLAATLFVAATVVVLKVFYNRTI